MHSSSIFVSFVLLISFYVVHSFRAPITATALSKSLRPIRSPRITAGTKLFARNNVDGVEIEGDLKPIHNFVFVKVKEVQQATASGIILPDNAKEKPTEGLAVAVGPGRYHSESGVKLDMGVKVGQNVLYGKYDGSAVKYNNENYHILRDDDVLLVYPGGTTASADNVECTKDYVLIRFSPKEDKSQAGIYLVKDKDRPSSGTVVKVGPGKQAVNGNYIPIPFKAGAGVKFREYGGTNVKLDGQEYMIIKAADVLATW